MSVYNAMQDDRFLPIANLDEGFLRPTYEEQVIVSYMQAGLVCDFIGRHYGEMALREVLYAFRDGLKTVAAIESVLRTTTSDFDKEFAQFVSDEHGAVLEQLEKWHHTQTEIGNKIAAEEWRETAELAKQLIAIIPQHVDADSPYLALARAQRELGEQAAALSSLETFWRNGGYDPSSLNRLSQWLVDADREATAIEVLQSINLVDPLDLELHGRLGDMLLASGQAEDAVREFEIALALEPHDMATAWYRLAQAQHELGNIGMSQEYLLQALDVAPNFRPAQRLLLRLANSPID
jgi:tetratricopeptide (TPR) repeat protein